MDNRTAILAGSQKWEMPTQSDRFIWQSFFVWRYGMKKIIEYALIVVFLVVFIVAGYRLYEMWKVYHEAEQEYETLQKFVKEPEKKPDRNEPEDQAGQGQSETIIDFESLRKINPDIVAWLRIEAAGIDYPVVRGVDNEYYLHHTFRGESNIAGSIFMDCRNEDFTDEKVILYGHNMRDGSMFAGLKNLDVSDTPIAVIYTPQGILQYQLYEEEYVSPIDEIYQIQEFTVERHSNSRATDKIDSALILSTCSNDGFRRHVFIGSTCE